jgi:hypothetical protein
MEATMTLVRKTIKFGGFTIGALVAGFGIPLLWLLIAGQLQGGEGVQRMTVTTAAALFPGIVVSYAAVMWIAGWGMSRSQPAGARTAPPRTHYPWLRSMRDEPGRPAKATSLEVMFIAAASALSVAFMVWFVLWAGNPLPA